MADQDVIKEFLVGLGFKVDDAQQKKFANSIGASTAKFMALYHFAEKAVLAVSRSISKFVSGMESMYFASQRNNTTVANIKALELAAQGLGASSAEALGSLEGVAAFMRNIPGGEGFIRGLGVQTRDANGKLRDTSELLVDIGKQLAKMDFAHARVRAQVLGIDDKTLMALRSGDFERDFRKAQTRLNSADFSGAAAKAKQFGEKIRDIGAEFSIMGVKIEAALLTRIGPKLDQFLAWMQTNGPVIADRIAQLAEKFIDFAERAAPYVAALIDWLVKADEVTDGWSTKILALVAAFKLLGGSITGTVAALPGFIASMGKLGLVGAAGYGGYQAGTAAYSAIEGTDFADKLGYGIAKALAFLGNEDARETVERADRYILGEGAQPGGAKVDQTTNINVYGQDAATAGQSVAREQDRVNQRLMRNLITTGIRG